MILKMMFCAGNCSCRVYPLQSLIFVLFVGSYKGGREGGSQGEKESRISSHPKDLAEHR